MSARLNAKKRKKKKKKQERISIANPYVKVRNYYSSINKSKEGHTWSVSYTYGCEAANSSPQFYSKGSCEKDKQKTKQNKTKQN